MCSPNRLRIQAATVEEQINEPVGIQPKRGLTQAASSDEDAAGSGEAPSL
jgi:hypothetical protein